MTEENTEIETAVTVPLRSVAINELATALAKAQGEFKPVTKSRTIEIAGRPVRAYATLDDVITATRPALASNALAVVQTTPMVGITFMVETVLLHQSGQWYSSRLPVRVDEGKGMNSAQAQGSGLTYARRQGYSALVCVAPDDDDDGEASGSKGKPIQPPKGEAIPSQLARTAPKAPDAGKASAPGEKTAEVGRGNCPACHVAFVHHVGVTKKGENMGRPYDFWCCPGKLADGTFCKERPEGFASQFLEHIGDVLLSPDELAPPRILGGNPEPVHDGSRDYLVKMAARKGKPIPDFTAMTQPEAMILYDQWRKLPNVEVKA